VRHFISLLGITVLSLILVFGCGKPEEPPKVQKPTAPSQATPAKPEAVKQEPLAQKPGQEGTTKLQRYDEPGMAISTEYPDTMTLQGTGSGEGAGFIFTFKPQGNPLDKAKVHIFLPRGAATAAAQEPFVTGPQGFWKTTAGKMKANPQISVSSPLSGSEKSSALPTPKTRAWWGKYCWVRPAVKPFR
jgi:hypothetical protein